MFRFSFSPRVLPAAFAAALIVLAGLALPALAQQPATCADCLQVTPKSNALRVNQNLCPGLTAVVCEGEYTPLLSVCRAAAAPAPGQLQNCRILQKVVNYQVRKHPGVVCGRIVAMRRNGSIFKTTCPKPPANGPLGLLRGVAQICVGRRWGGPAPQGPQPLTELFALGFETPYGLTSLPEGISTLDSTLVTLETSLLQAALERGELETDGEYAYLQLTIESTQPAVGFLHHSLATLDLEVARGELIVDDARQAFGLILVDLRVPLASLGAFADYALDLGGLTVSTFKANAVYTSLAEEPLVPQFPLPGFHQPALETLPEDGKDLVLLTPPKAELYFAAELWSGGEPLVTGMGLVGLSL